MRILISVHTAHITLKKIEKNINKCETRNVRHGYQKTTNKTEKILIAK